MSGLGPITIRICPGNSAATDWSGVMPEQVTFAGCMVRMLLFFGKHLKYSR